MRCCMHAAARPSQAVEHCHVSPEGWQATGKLLMLCHDMSCHVMSCHVMSCCLGVDNIQGTFGSMSMCTDNIESRKDLGAHKSMKLTLISACLALRLVRSVVGGLLLSGISKRVVTPPTAAAEVAAVMPAHARTDRSGPDSYVVAVLSSEVHMLVHRILPI